MKDFFEDSKIGTFITMLVLSGILILVLLSMFSQIMLSVNSGVEKKRIESILQNRSTLASNVKFSSPSVRVTYDRTFGNLTKLYHADFLFPAKIDQSFTGVDLREVFSFTIIDVQNVFMTTNGSSSYQKLESGPDLLRCDTGNQFTNFWIKNNKTGMINNSKFEQQYPAGDYLVGTQVYYEGQLCYKDNFIPLGKKSVRITSVKDKKLIGEFPVVGEIEFINFPK